MSIGKIKMHGTKPKLEVTKTPRDTDEFEKVEIPNPTVQKSITKVQARYPSFWTQDNRYHESINRNAPEVTGKDMDRYNHWKKHEGWTNVYREAHRNKEDDLRLIPESKHHERAYKHYTENVDADKDLYDYLMKTTKGNGEH